MTAALTPPIDLRADHLRIVRDVLRQHLPTGVQVWVFGSRANWATKDSSDLDLALEGAGEIPPRIVLALEAAFEDSDLPFAVAVVDFGRITEQFRQIVERERVPLPLAAMEEQVLVDSRAKLAEDWRHARWGDLVTLEYGRSLRRFATGNAVYRVFGTNGQIGWHDRALSEHASIIVGRKGAYRGIHYSPDPCFVIDTAFYLKPKVEMDIRWAYYTLLTYDINGLDSGSAIPSTSRADFYDLPVSVPSLSEQRAIAHILGTLDDKIELNRRMNATLEAIARALVKSWFVDFDPVRAKMEGRNTGLPTEIADMFPDRLVDSESGAVPIGWDTGVLAETVEILGGGTPRTSVNHYWNGDIPWYTPKDAPAPSDVFVVATEKTITQAGVDNSSTTVLPAGTTVITARGTVGRLACLGVPMAMNQTCYGIRGADAYQSQDYFVYWLVRGTVEELRSRTHGTVFDTITRQTFASVNLPLPAVSVAKEFECAVSPIMGRILGNLHQVGVLTALRDTLLPELISGKLQLYGQQRLIMDDACPVAAEALET